MNISIFASIGCQNLGDELILKNEIELLKNEFMQPSSLEKRGDSEVSFVVASYDPKNPVFEIADTEYFEYFPLGIRKAKNILRNIKNFFTFLRVILWSDIVVIGGGGIIYDSEVQSVGNPLKQWLFRVKVARFFRKKIYFYALGIDIKQEDNIKILKNIFKKAYKITVRDIKSQEILKKIGISSELVDDPVMSENLQPSSLVKRRDSEMSLRPCESDDCGENSQKGTILASLSSRDFSLADLSNINFQGKEVGLALRSGYIGKSGKSQIEKLLISELCLYIEKQGGKVVFLPHSFHNSDILANDYKFMEGFVREGREIKTSLEEVYEWYARPVSVQTSLRIIISMRLHSIILASVYNIPQIVLSYSQKTDEVIKKLQDNN